MPLNLAVLMPRSSKFQNSIHVCLLSL